jgi:transmembrane sensor
VTPGSNRLPADPDDAAIWWATRRQMDPKRFVEDARFAAWLADPRHARAWDEIDTRVDLVGNFAAQAEVREMREAALDMVRTRRPDRRRYWVAGIAMAASLAAGIIWSGAPTAIGPAAIAPPRQMAAGNLYTTKVGERREFTLPDGSRVALNTGSTLEVAYSRDRRDVRLLAGQALFHVAKDKARPFVVAAGSRLITATGTAFDVEIKRGGGVAVMLVEGHVRVDTARPKGLARLIPWIDRDELEPGQRLIAPVSGDAVVAFGDVERETAWNRGVLIFRDDRLADAVAEINRYSTTMLVVEDPKIADLRVSGVFPTTQEKDFVAALEAFYPITARQRSPGAVILVWDTEARP